MLSMVLYPSTLLTVKTVVLMFSSGQRGTVNESNTLGNRDLKSSSLDKKINVSLPAHVGKLVQFPFSRHWLIKTPDCETNPGRHSYSMVDIYGRNGEVTFAVISLAFVTLLTGHTISET